MKKIIFLLFLVSTLNIIAQNEKINGYKYIIVPEKFDFLKTSDQYQTSSLTKFLLKKKGFIVFLRNEQLPKDLLENRCLALVANVIDASSMFTVKSKIELKDCHGKLLYSSKIGKSKEKDYKKSYHISIRNAFESMTDLEYKYIPVKEKVIKNEVTSPIKKDIPVKIIPDAKKVTPIKKAVSNDNKTKQPIQIETLYAQAKNNGFQLVNTTPAVVFQVLKTNVNDVYIIKDKNGIIYKKLNFWVAEYYENNKLVSKSFLIKF